MYGNGKVTKQPSDGPQEQRIIRRGGMIIEFDHEIIMDDVIEYIVARPWCDGNIGLNGISYFAVSQ